ncbi:MAG: hypothetical protein R3358_02475 [Woeseiaceae bacterium]|nr:hypothetical protein [Woeseiaceae bacterium]
MNTTRIAALAASLAMISGCATVTRGTTDMFEIQSTPDNANVRLSNGMSCNTPCSLSLPRKHEFTATIAMDGYKPIDVQVMPKQAGAGTAGFAGNVLIGGVVGMVADSVSGAMKDLYPNPLIVELAPVGSDTESFVHYPPDDEADAEDAEDVDVSEDETDVVAATASPDQEARAD